jgi:8-oxo-dGTP pyrophosphatase MutT (NUDIX family)
MLTPIDIVDRFNRPTGKTSNPDEASDKGLWHRGAHVIVLTPNGSVLIQKRAHDAIQRPSLVDIGAGGFVDTGEFPEQTAIRELQEETGITLTVNDLIFLGTTRYNHHWKSGKHAKLSRSIIYNYTALLPHEHNHVAAQTSETEWVGFIPAKSALWLLHRGRLIRYGRLIPTLAYYRKLFRKARTVLDIQGF